LPASDAYPAADDFTLAQWLADVMPFISVVAFKVEPSNKHHVPLRSEPLPAQAAPDM
jgi:hypothetical protein